MSAAMAPEARQLGELLTRGLMVQAVSAVAKLGVPDLLADRPLTAEELALSTGAHAQTLYRLLRSLTGLGIFSLDDAGRFSLTALGGALRSGPGSVRELAIFLGEPFVWQSWGNLRHSLATGEPAFRHTHGRTLFEYLDEDDGAAAVFHSWMTQQSDLETRAILAGYDFSRFRTLVDVGGGHGTLLAAILSANPALEGVLYDLPEVVAGAARLRESPLSVRSRIEAGSFLDSVPAGADAYLLKFVTHDWDDEHAVAILRNVRSAIADDGTLLLLELVIPPGDDYHRSKFLDLQMLALMDGGRERTEDEYATMLERSGFRLTRVLPTRSPISLVEAAPV